MTPKAQRIAIAEACGWTMDKADHGLMWHEGKKIARIAPGTPVAAARERMRLSPDKEIPDYLNDLNAMHEAEKVLTPHQRIAYVGQVMDDICADGEWTTDEDWCLLNTPAAQRAGAFLRVKGLWV